MPYPNKKNALKIAIAEDHVLVRKAFKDYINQYQDCDVVLEIDDGRKLLKVLEHKHIDIDVLLLDLFSPQMDGRDALRSLSKLHSSIKVLVLSACSDQKIINDVFELGAYGFISKMSEPEELHDAIVSAANRKVHKNSYFAIHNNVILSPSEVMLLELIWAEKTSEEISRTMCLSTSSVEKIKHQLKEKTKTKTTLGLVKYALDRRIISQGNIDF